jgi:hypothetical protein
MNREVTPVVHQESDKGRNCGAQELVTGAQLSLLLQLLPAMQNRLIVSTGVIMTCDVGANKPTQLVAGVSIPQTINLHGYMCGHHGGHTRATGIVMEEMGSDKHSQLVVGSLSTEDTAIYTTATDTVPCEEEGRHKTSALVI